LLGVITWRIVVIQTYNKTRAQAREDEIGAVRHSLTRRKAAHSSCSCEAASRRSSFQDWWSNEEARDKMEAAAGVC